MPVNQGFFEIINHFIINWLVLMGVIVEYVTKEQYIVMFILLVCLNRHGSMILWLMGKEKSLKFNFD